METNELLERMKKVPRKLLAQRASINYPYLSSIINGTAPLPERRKEQLINALDSIEKETIAGI